MHLTLKCQMGRSFYASVQWNSVLVVVLPVWKERSRLRRAVNPLRFGVCTWLQWRPVNCRILSALALQPPLHKRKTFRTACSDWLSRIHWVWRVLKPFCALITTRGQVIIKTNLYTIILSNLATSGFLRLTVLICYAGLVNMIKALIFQIE